jgi:hypothetical protein
MKAHFECMHCSRDEVERLRELPRLHEDALHQKETLDVEGVEPQEVQESMRVAGLHTPCQLRSRAALRIRITVLPHVLTVSHCVHAKPIP